jgi:hypothetical protein
MQSRALQSWVPGGGPRLLEEAEISPFVPVFNLAVLSFLELSRELSLVCQKRPGRRLLLVTSWKAELLLLELEYPEELSWLEPEPSSLRRIWLLSLRRRSTERSMEDRRRVGPDDLLALGDLGCPSMVNSF